MYQILYSGPRFLFYEMLEKNDIKLPWKLRPK